MLYIELVNHFVKYQVHQIDICIALVLKINTIGIKKLQILKKDDDNSLMYFTLFNAIQN
jgi:hypothetical protein